MTLNARSKIVIISTALAMTVVASAEAKTFYDKEGRPIRISSQTKAAQPSVYAKILRNAVHGSEIARVTVLVVARSSLTRLCASVAAGCYRSDSETVIVPAGKEAAVSRVLLHEYGHHLDRTVRGVGPESNGGSHWFKALGLAKLVKSGQLGYGDNLAWDRKISEMWAENYADLYHEPVFCWLQTGCLTTKGRRSILRDVTGRKPLVPKPTESKRTLDLSEDETLDVVEEAHVTGGTLAATVIPESELPNPGSTCEVSILRDEQTVEGAAGPGKITLRRRHAAGGNYAIQFRGGQLGCKGSAEIVVP